MIVYLKKESTFIQSHKHSQTHSHTRKTITHRLHTQQHHYIWCSGLNIFLLHQCVNIKNKAFNY